MVSYCYHDSDYDDSSIRTARNIVLESPEYVTDDYIVRLQRWHAGSLRPESRSDQFMNYTDEIMYFLYSYNSQFNLSYDAAARIMQRKTGSVDVAAIMGIHACVRSRDKSKLSTVAAQVLHGTKNNDLKKYVREIVSYTEDGDINLLTKAEVQAFKSMLPKTLYYEVVTLHATICLYKHSYSHAYELLSDLLVYCPRHFISPEEIYVLISRCELGIGMLRKSAVSAQSAFSINRSSTLACTQLLKSLVSNEAFEPAELLLKRIDETVYEKYDIYEKEEYNFIKYIIFRMTKKPSIEYGKIEPKLPNEKRYVIAAFDYYYNIEVINSAKILAAALKAKNLTVTDFHILLPYAAQYYRINKDEEGLKTFCKRYIGDNDLCGYNKIHCEKVLDTNINKSESVSFPGFPVRD